ncbi:MAG TPA: nucleoside-diphosphate sugar epimerase/dehydratase [Candidatus Dormibacteraeota bacterium]|nr:nucleoside-diphosphate sugar epimerase/dehydratase [Candidatus Dormibacteraeota bacterium]
MSAPVPRLAWVPRGRHLFLFDIVVVFMSILTAFALRFDANDVFLWLRPYLPVAFLPLVVYPPVFVAFGLYRREWRYASINEMFSIVGAVLVGTGITFVVELILAVANVPGTTGYPRSIPVIEALLIVALVGGGRFALRAGLERRGISGGTDEELGVKTIVYGAGDTGGTVARVATRDPAARLSVVGFLDDDRAKTGSRLLGKTVFGDLDALQRAVNSTGATQLLVAMPSAPGSKIRRVFDAGRRLGLEVRTVPHPRELLNGELQTARVRRVSVEDLLRRESIEIDAEALEGYINGASVLVTGGGGSIGSELVRQVLALGPRRLIVLDNHEESLWSIERELSERTAGAGGIQFEPVLCDVRSFEALDAVLARVQPDVIFHAAALKHVPIVELHPSEGVMTNVVGTRNALRASERRGVERFVLISTDKAVDPVGAMGATKRMAELLTVSAAHRTGLPYVAVRFGNVLGSSGSVVPTFQHQLSEGLPLTITHPDTTRYFMTIAEAVSLIMEAGSSASSGEIYVLDMGEPVRIVDLARDLVRLSGLDPDRVPIVYTGLRPGERLHETLFYDHETTERTLHEGILRVRAEGALSDETTETLADELTQAAVARDDDRVRRILHKVSALGAVSLRHAPSPAAASGPPAQPSGPAMLGSGDGPAGAVAVGPGDHADPGVDPLTA